MCSSLSPYVTSTSLAKRVAVERGGRVGGVVGYAVRLESRRSADTRLLFCTTGVLLRRLQVCTRHAAHSTQHTSHSTQHAARST